MAGAQHINVWLSGEVDSVELVHGAMEAGSVLSLLCLGVLSRIGNISSAYRLYGHGLGHLGQVSVSLSVADKGVLRVFALLPGPCSCLSQVWQIL
jgi:hypothetical protein